VSGIHNPNKLTLVLHTPPTKGICGVWETFEISSAASPLDAGPHISLTRVRWMSTSSLLQTKRRGN